MNFMQPHSNLCSKIPPKSTAYHASPEAIESGLGIAKHERKVFRNVVQQDLERRSFGKFRSCPKDVIEKEFVLLVKIEVVRIPSTEKLQAHFHQLFTRQLRAGKRVEDNFAVLGEKFLALLDTVDVGVFEFQPPIRLKLCKCCSAFLVTHHRESNMNQSLHIV